MKHSSTFILTTQLIVISVFLLIPGLSFSAFEQPIDNEESVTHSDHSATQLQTLHYPDNDTLPGQKPKDTLITRDLYEIVITASRYEQNMFSLPRSMTIASNREIKEKNRMSVLDALDDKIGVWIEKRTTTTSDPVIRGLSGANILALVDGNSLSTFWGEGGFAGDDMYGKIDGESIERIEIIRGPASVMYGSNALGGVINFITKKSPLDYKQTGFHSGGRLKSAYASSFNYMMGRAETWGAGTAFKYFIGSSYHRAGDIRAGGDVGRIVPSGGENWSMDMNTEVKISSNRYIQAGAQYFNRPEAYKSFRPKESNTNERLALNIGYLDRQSTFFYDRVQFNLYHQYKKDTRQWYSDKTQSEMEKEGFAWWRTYSSGIHALKTTGQNNKILYGISYQLDVAESPDDEQFTIITPAGNQQAAPQTQWHNLGMYIHDDWQFSELLTFSAGLRYDYFLLNAGNNIFYTKPGDADTTRNKAITDPGRHPKHAITGSAACVLHVHDNVNLAFTWARGFRMFPPSFGFRQTGYGVLTPNGLLDPVTANMWEISPRIRSSFFEMIIAAYYTNFNNFQQPIMGEYNGNEYIDYNNNGIFEPDERVYVNNPDGKAWVAGIELEFEYDLASLNKVFSNFTLAGGAMYNYGRMKFPEKDEAPLRHTHPLRIITKLRYDQLNARHQKWLELTADWVGKYDQIENSRLLSDVGYLDNPQDPNSGLYRDYGLPSYNVFHLRGGIIISKRYTITLALENIFDVRYRTAHSRMDASGRNFIVGFEVMMDSFRN